MGLEVEGVVAPAELKKFFKILNQPQGTPPSRAKSGWTSIESVAQLGNGTIKIVETVGHPLLLCMVNGHFYAYRTACDMPFDVAPLKDNLLSCRLGHRYHVQHAGICTDDPDIHLNPFPLLVEDDMVKAALE